MNSRLQFSMPAFLMIAGALAHFEDEGGREQAVGIADHQAAQAGRLRRKMGISFWSTAVHLEMRSNVSH